MIKITKNDFIETIKEYPAFHVVYAGSNDGKFLNNELLNMLNEKIIKAGLLNTADYRKLKEIRSRDLINTSLKTGKNYYLTFRNNEYFIKDNIILISTEVNKIFYILDADKGLIEND